MLTKSVFAKAKLLREIIMDFDKLPKALKKTIRYIKQDATLEQIKQIELFMVNCITERRLELSGRTKRKL
jgi:hypothetical protein